MAEVDLWTTCFTPRELRLLAGGRGPRGRAPLVGHARAPTGRDRAHHRSARAPARRPPAVTWARTRGVPCPALRGACRGASPILPIPDSLKAYSLVRRHPDLRAQPRSHRRPQRQLRHLRRRRHLHPPPDHRRRPRRQLRRRHRRHARVGRGRPARRGHRRQGRPGRGPARHRLQVRGRDPQPRAVDPQRRRPQRDRVAGRQDRGPRPHQGGQGRPARPVQEAGPVRAGLGRHRAHQGRGRRRHRPGHRGRQGRPDPRHRPPRLPARLARRAAPGARPAALRRARRSRPRSSSSTRTATTSCCPAGPGSRRRRRSSARTSSPTSSRARSAAASCRAS